MKRTTALLSILAFPCTLYADDFDYTFIEAGFVSSEVDVGPFNADGDGFRIGGSYALKDNIHLLAAYTHQNYNYGVDGRSINVGVGFNTPLSSMLDFVADLSYVDADVANQFGSSGENGYNIGAGVRAQLRKSIELEGGISYLDLDRSDTSLHVGGRYYFSDTIAVGASLVDNDAGLGWNIGVRAEFGR